MQSRNSAGRAVERGNEKEFEAGKKGDGVSVISGEVVSPLPVVSLHHSDLWLNPCCSIEFSEPPPLVPLGERISEMVPLAL